MKYVINFTCTKNLRKYNIEYYIVKIKTKAKVVFMFRDINAEFNQPHYYLPHHYHIYMSS